MVPVDAQRQDTSELVLAAHLCGATVPYISEPGVFIWIDSRKLYESAISQVQSLMDKEKWDQAYSEGQNMPFDQAIALAIQSLKESVIRQ
jgi:hypothetical protein